MIAIESRVAVVVHVDVDAIPGASEERSFIPDDDVVFEGEGAVFFGVGGLDLIESAEGEDVV